MSFNLPLVCKDSEAAINASAQRNALLRRSRRRGLAIRVVMLHSQLLFQAARVESNAGSMEDDMLVQSGGSEEGRWSADDREAVHVGGCVRDRLQPLLPCSV